MSKEKFFSGIFIIAGLVFGSLFTNLIYQDYLAYGGQIKSLTFHNENLYRASMSLFFYILFKRGKQYAILCLAGYLLKPWLLLYGFTFCIAFFLGSMLSLQIIQLGITGLILVILSLFPHFICYGISLCFLLKRNFMDTKKEEMLYTKSRSSFSRFSVIFEISFMILGCIMESFINPSIMSEVVKFWK